MAPKSNKDKIIKAELTYGQIILVPSITNIKESKLSNGAIYRLLDMSFVRIVSPQLPPEVDPKGEVYVLKIDGGSKQFIFDTKDELINVLTKRVREHPEFKKGLQVLL